MKNVVKLILISALALVVVSCGNVNDSSDTEKETSSVSSISETDSSNESSETESFEVYSSETDSSEDEKVTTTLDDSSKVEKTTTTKKTTTQSDETTTTQPVVTQAPITKAPKTTTTVKQTAKPATTTTVKQTVKQTTTTTKKTETVKKDKYQLAFDKVGGYNNHIGEKGYGYTTADLETIREYYINYAVSKFGSRILNANQKFIPFYDNNGKLTYVSTSNQVPATWQYYYSAEEITKMERLIDVYIEGWLDGDTTSDLKNESSAWDVFWIIDPNTKTVSFSVAIFLK